MKLPEPMPTTMCLLWPLKTHFTVVPFVTVRIVALVMATTGPGDACPGTGAADARTPASVTATPRSTARVIADMEG